MRKLEFGLAMLTAAAVLGGVGQARAQGSEWNFTGVAYLWLAGVDGTVATFGAPGVDVSQSINDVMKEFNAGVMGMGEARRGRWSVAGDVLWVRLSEDQDVPVAGLASSVNVTTESAMVTAVGGYALIQDEGKTLDLVAGARYWSVENTLRFQGGVLNGVSASDRADWVDPLVGIKGKVALGPRLDFNGWALVGADSMWDVTAALGYSVGKTLSVGAGWRVLGVDRRKGSFVYDVRQSGPILGASLRF